MIRAAVDSGSRRIGLVIGSDSPADIEAALDYIDHATFDVGHEEQMAVPELVTPRPYTKPDGTVVTRDPYWKTKVNVVTDEEEQSAADAVIARLVAAGAQHVTLEYVRSVYLGKKSVRGGAKTATNIIIAERIMTWIRAGCRALGIQTAIVIRRTWHAAIQRFAKAAGTPLGSVRRAGTALDPILRKLIVDWPDAKGADVRDAGAMLIASLLPPPVKPPRKPRVARPPGERKPRGHREPTSRARLAEVAPDKLKKLREQGARAERKRRAKAAVPIKAARDAAGCICGHRRGRHKAACPMHVAKPSRDRAHRLAAVRAT